MEENKTPVDGEKTPEAEQPESLEEQYSRACQQIGDVQVCIATYEGMKCNLLIQAGKLLQEMQKLRVVK